ncbi:MAG: hypothetical protein ACK4ZW_08350 [Blastomonas sp.]
MADEELSAAEKARIVATVNEIVAQAKGPLVTYNQHFPRGSNAWSFGFNVTWGAITAVCIAGGVAAVIAKVIS